MKTTPSIYNTSKVDAAIHSFSTTILFRDMTSFFPFSAFRPRGLKQAGIDKSCFAVRKDYILSMLINLDASRASVHPFNRLSSKDNSKIWQ